MDLTMPDDNQSLPVATFCSICGEDVSKVGPMAEVRDRGNNRDLIRICRDCARLVIQAIDDETERRKQSPPNQPPGTV
jgi:hypothetical protein